MPEVIQSKRKFDREEEGIKTAMGSKVAPRRADADLQLDVDLLILDYLMYMATKALLEECDSDESYHSDCSDGDSSSDLVLPMVDSFIRSFQVRHPRVHVSKGVQLRLCLLRLTCLFTRRLTRCASTPSREALRGLREGNRRRAAKYRKSEDSLSSDVRALLDMFDGFHLSDEQIRRNRGNFLGRLGVSTSASSIDHYGSLESVSLMDLLPSFILLSAARAHLEVTNANGGIVVQPLWMEMAAEWMLQAVLEQYLVYGRSDVEALKESFAWGFDEDLSYKTKPSEDSYGDDEPLMNALFAKNASDGHVGGVSEAELWTETKGRFVQKVSNLTLRYSIIFNYSLKLYAIRYAWLESIS